MGNLDAERERVQHAELKYTRASAIAAKIEASGTAGLEDAVRNEEQARTEYIHALEKLTLLLRNA